MRTRTSDWWDRFFNELARTGGNVRAAADFVEKHHSTVYRALRDREIPEFRCRFELVMLEIQQQRYRRAEYRKQAA